MAAKKSLHPPSRRSKRPPRETIPVKSGWLVEDEAAPSRRGKPPRRETLEVKLEWLEEEPLSSRRAPKRASLRPKPSHPPARRGPPPLPTSVAKPKRALPPPLPREEPDEARPVARRRSLKPPKR